MFEKSREEVHDLVGELDGRLRNMALDAAIAKRLADAVYKATYKAAWVAWDSVVDDGLVPREVATLVATTAHAVEVVDLATKMARVAALGVLEATRATEKGE